MNKANFLTAKVENEKVVGSENSLLSVPWWSFTKTVLAAASLLLVNKGKLTLDERLKNQPLTLRQLLQHRAGVPDYGPLPEYHTAVARKNEPWTEKELLQRVNAEKLLFVPGEGWAYSNVGYLYVRRLIEEASEEEIGMALHRLIFSPLGLAGVRFAREPVDLANTAWGNKEGYHPGWVYHGLLIGTPTEAVLLLHRLMTGDLLSKNLLKTMCERHPLGGEMPGRPWRTAGYGLGLMIDIASSAGKCCGHTGQGPDSTVAVYHFPSFDPPRTAAVFASIEEQGVVEKKVIDLVST